MIRPFKDIIPKIDPSAFIAETAVIIGDVEIGPLSSIWYNSVVRGDVNSIRIGKGTNIQDLSMLHVTHRKEAPGSRRPAHHRRLCNHRPQRDPSRLHHRKRCLHRHAGSGHGQGRGGRRGPRGSPRPGNRGNNNPAPHLVARRTGPLQAGSDRRGIGTNPDLGQELHPLCRRFQETANFRTTTSARQW